MIRIAYRSRAARPDLALLALADIIAVSSRNNSRDGLTGALLVSRDRFFQVLEGAPVDIDRALRRIAADPRHSDITEVLRRPAEGRLFPNWSMVAARITPDLQPRIDGVIDACETAPLAAVQALLDLVNRQQAG